MNFKDKTDKVLKKYSANKISFVGAGREFRELLKEARIWEKPYNPMNYIVCMAACFISELREIKNTVTNYCEDCHLCYFIHSFENVDEGRILCYHVREKREKLWKKTLGIKE